MITGEKNIRYYYKTAYSPIYNAFVKITHVHVDSDGLFIFTCSFDYMGERLSGVLFREIELTRFCL